MHNLSFKQCAMFCFISQQKWYSFNRWSRCGWWSKRALKMESRIQPSSLQCDPSMVPHTRTYSTPTIILPYHCRRKSWLCCWVLSQLVKEDSGLNSFSCVYCSMIIFNCPGSARLSFNKILFTEGKGRKASATFAFIYWITKRFRMCWVYYYFHLRWNNVQSAVLTFI